MDRDLYGGACEKFKCNFSGDREEIRKEATKAGIKKMIEVMVMDCVFPITYDL